MISMLSRMFDYHAWANQDLFAVLARLDPVVQRDCLQAALRLVSHHHVVARIFAGHLTGALHGYRADNVAVTPDLHTLQADVVASDRWYCDFVRDMRPDALAETVAFTFTDGDRGCMSRAEMLTHVVLHAGYHRGEAGRLVGQAGMSPPWDTFAVFLHRTEPARRLNLNPRG